MFKTLIIATAATVSLAVLAPAHAYFQHLNGTELNGINLNSLTFNGINANGRQIQGRSLHGAEPGHISGMRVVGVELPASR